MKKIIIQKPSWKLSQSNTCISFLAGVLAPPLINNIARLLGIKRGLGDFIVALIVFVITGWILEYCAPVDKKKFALIRYMCLVCFGLIFGAVLDAILDFKFRSYDHNLLPFEILIWWIFAPLPMSAGIMLRRSNKKINNDNDLIRNLN